MYNSDLIMTTTNCTDTVDNVEVNAAHTGGEAVKTVMKYIVLAHKQEVANPKHLGHTYSKIVTGMHV